jgi:hypothetical protein
MREPYTFSTLKETKKLLLKKSLTMNVLIWILVLEDLLLPLLPKEELNSSNGKEGLWLM